MTLDILTGVLCLIGAIQAVVFWVQAGRLKESVEETRKATATIDNKAAVELRAYLNVTLEGADGPGIWTDTIPRIRLGVTNGGKTPASDVTTAFAVRLLLKESNVSGELPLPESTGTRHGMLAIGATLPVSLDGAPSPKGEWGKYDVGSGYCLFVYGTVTYTDVFKQRRQTNFCRFVNWKNGTPEAPATEYGNDFT